MRRTAAAARYFFGAAYFDRMLEAERTWLALATAPGGELAAASIAAVSDGFLHYYLSRQRRLPPARLADEERRRRARRALRRARPAAQSRRRHHPRRPAGGVQARLRQPRASPGTPRSSSATRGATQRSAPIARPAASSRPTGPSSGLADSAGPLVRFERRRPGERERFDRLAAVPAPGRLAEGADRVERDRPLVGAGSRAGWSRSSPPPRRAFCRSGRAASPRTSCRRDPSAPAGLLRADPGSTGSPSARARASGRSRFPPAFPCRRRRPAGRAVRRARRRSAGWSCSAAAAIRAGCVRAPRPAAAGAACSRPAWRRWRRFATFTGGGAVPARLSGSTPLVEPIEALRLMCASPFATLLSLPPLARMKTTTAIARTSVAGDRVADDQPCAVRAAARCSRPPRAS